MSAREWRATSLETSTEDAEDILFEIKQQWGVDVTLEIKLKIHINAEPRIHAQIIRYLEELEAI